MSKHDYKEKPFEYLKRKNGEGFSSETIKNWYIARAYVLEKLKDVAICQGSKEHLEVTITGDSPLMLCVARQVALSAHYANFDETNPIRTVITVVSKNPQIIEALQMEEYLCNLPLFCKLTVNGSEPKNADSHVDIELRVVDHWHENATGNALVMSEDDVKAFLSKKSEGDIYCIDTRKAVFTDRMYSLGSWIDNLPNEDIHNAQRYAMALNVFQHSLLRKPIVPLVNAKKWESNVIAVKNGLSNVFCADCFESRAKGVVRYAEANGMIEEEAWEDCIEGLSKSEHARWVVEKLIMGFRPITERERMVTERLFGAERRQFFNQLKKNPQDPVHVDLCSFAQLRRINPYDMKYDSFLMLAIPGILQKLKINYSKQPRRIRHERFIQSQTH